MVERRDARQALVFTQLGQGSDLFVGTAVEAGALNVPARVKLVLRSKNRHRVDGVLHRQKLVLKRDLDAGRSTVVVKGSRLLADTWVVTGTARATGVDSATVKKLLVVVVPPPDRRS